MTPTSKIYVAGHRGMVGSAIVRLLIKQGYTNLITYETDLMNQAEVDYLFKVQQPEYVFLVAGKVGGIKANNTYRGEFIYNNLMIAANVIHAAYQHGVKKLLYTGSSCIYPRDCLQPIREEELLRGPLEFTNQPYAIAKIAGIEMCEAYRAQYGCNFISAMPTNCYGPGDKYDPENSHVLPALIRKFITACRRKDPTIPIWGTGKARREFIYVDDLADALIFLMQNYDEPGVVNIGTFEEYSILQLAELLKYITRYQGEFVFDGQLDGTPRKLLDSLKLYRMGWKHRVGISEGVSLTIKSLTDANVPATW